MMTFSSSFSSGVRLLTLRYAYPIDDVYVVDDTVPYSAFFFYKRKLTECCDIGIMIIFINTS